MTHSGYLIARNRAAQVFFTSASSYDRPSWTTLKEAKVYVSAEQADQAVKKLLRHGAYEARIVSVQEAMSFEFPTDQNPDEEQPDDAVLPNDGEAEDGEVDGDDDMVAQHQDEVCPECEGSPCECEDSDGEIGGEQGDGESDDLEQMIDDELRGGSDGKHHSEESDDLENRLSVGKGGTGIGGAMPVPGMRESAAYKTIEYKNPSSTQDKPHTDLYQSGALPHDTAVKIPANVLSDLVAAIKKFDDCAEFSKTTSDDKASFCMTVAEAFRAVLVDLKLGTAGSIKDAQIKVTSWMNPITSNLPISVQKFIYMGGRKPTLLDLFDSSRNVKESYFTESSFDRGMEKRAKIAKLRNEFVDLKEQIKRAKEEGKTKEVSRLVTKLGHIDDKIQDLSEK